MDAQSARPDSGRKITCADGRLRVPDRPVVLFLEGDGIGPDIWRASRRVFDAAVEKAYGGSRAIEWKEIYAGEKAVRVYGEGRVLPEETLAAIHEFRVAIKGPLATPVSGGIRSINVALRRNLDLYACVRPVRWYEGVPTPMREPGKLDVVIFRENTEDVYAGIEWPAGSAEAESLIEALAGLGHRLAAGATGIGVKPVSRGASRRLVRRAIRHAIDRALPVVTLVHKGNIQKFTEGAFRTWGYELAAEEFAGEVVTEQQLARDHGGVLPAGKVLLNDRIADDMFQQVLLYPERYRVLATTNLNGDYLSDACAAQVGGLGMAPGVNLSDECRIYEATHGTAPDLAGKDAANPGSLLLSGVMMLRDFGWDEAAESIERGLRAAIGEGLVTRDLARLSPGATEQTTSGFAACVVARLG